MVGGEQTEVNALWSTGCRYATHPGEAVFL
jgi:hypothetical protein